MYIVIPLVLGLSCSTIEEVYTHETYGIEKADMSRIMKSRKIGTSDTITAFLKGQVVDKETQEFLGGVTISLSDKNSDHVYGFFTDSTGLFSIPTPAGDYILDVHLGNYYRTKHRIKMGDGEIRELKIGLGIEKPAKYLFEKE